MPLYTSADDDNIFEGSGLMSYVWHVLIALDLRLVPAPQGEACGIVPRCVFRILLYLPTCVVCSSYYGTLEGSSLFTPLVKAVLEVISSPSLSAQRSLTQPPPRP